MGKQTGTARRAVLAIGAAIFAAVAIACGEDGEVGPAGPSVVEAPPAASAAAGAGALVEAAGTGSSVGQPDASGGDAVEVNEQFTEGVVRNATRVDATIAKPLMAGISRIGNNELSVRWAVASTTDISDYRIQWAPGCIAGWNRRLGAESIFFNSTGGLIELTGIQPAGGRLLHRAFKIRVRARMAANTATHRKGGPWSDPTIIYPGNPSDETEQICEEGSLATGAHFCSANIDGMEAQLEIDASLNAELIPGGGNATITATHAAGASIDFDGFLLEARTSPNGWEIVSLDQEWPRQQNLWVNSGSGRSPSA